MAPFPILLVVIIAHKRKLPVGLVQVFGYAIALVKVAVITVAVQDVVSIAMCVMKVSVVT